MRLKNLNVFKLSFCLAVLISIGFLSSCNDKPVDIGYSLINDTVSVRSITSAQAQLITNAESMLLRQQNINSGAILLGKTNNSIAITLMRFVIPDSLDYLKPSDIVSANLVLYPLNYILGNQSDNTLDFTIHKVTKYWTPTYATWDTLHYQNGSSDYFDPQSIGDFRSQKILLSDTITTIPLNDGAKSLLVEWFKNWMSSDTNDRYKIHGIALLPDNNTNVIRQFSGQGINDPNRNRPIIKMVFNNKNGALDSINIPSAYESWFADSPAPDNNSIIVQGGILYNTRIFFDVSMLPPISSIHRADIELTVDNSKSYWGADGMDTVLILQLMPDSTSTTPLQEYNGFNVAGTNKYVFSGRISAAVEWWTRHGGKGNMILRPFLTENLARRMNRLVFYGINDPDSTKRPNLKIIYSKRPDFQK